MIEELSENEILTPMHYLAERSDGLTFMQCVESAAGSSEIVANFDRLTGSNLLRRGAPINLMIDDATGKAKSDIESFLRFVWNCIFLRVPIEQSKQ